MLNGCVFWCGCMESNNNMRFAGLEWLATAVLVLDDERRICYINPAAENLLALSLSQSNGMALEDLFVHAVPLYAAMDYALAHNASFTEHELLVQTDDVQFLVSATFTPVESAGASFMLEFHAMDQQLKVVRD